MNFIEKIYNYDNITPDEIDEVTISERAILINSNDEVLAILMGYSTMNWRTSRE